MSTSTTATMDISPSGGGGGESRESSEFEFVDGKIPPPSALPSFDLVPPPSSDAPSEVEEEEEESSAASAFSWIPNSDFLSKFAEKTKNSMESVMTILDPQMKDYYSGKKSEIAVASDLESEVNPISEGFRRVLGSQTLVYGIPSKAPSVAIQPVGFAAGRQAAEERLRCVSSKGSDVVVAIQSFLLEVGEDSWVETGVLILHDSVRDIKITTYIQSVFVDVRFVDIVKEATSDSYPKKWSGLEKPIALVIGERLGVPHQRWHEHVTGGTTKEDIIRLGATTLAGMYKKSLLEKVDNV